MADRLILIPGNATQDGTNPAQEKPHAISFAADGLPHICGWTLYVPVSLRSASPLSLRLVFSHHGLIGTAELLLHYGAFGDGGPIPVPLSTMVAIPMPGGVPGLFAVDVDASSWFNENITTFIIALTRNSANPGDTFGGELDFVMGRML